MLSRNSLSAGMRKLINTVNVGDYHDYLNLIDEESIDLLLTDVPYNIGYLGHDWDSGDITRGGFDLNEWIELVASKVKKTGTAVVFCGDNQVGDLINGLLANGFGNPDDSRTYPRMFAWYKPNAKDRMRHKRQSKVFEAYVVATKSSDNTFNLRIETQLRGKGYEDGLLSYAATEDMRHRIHDTQKPNSLWKSLVEMYSNPEDIVLDPFGGSGITAATCSQLGRYYISIERTRSMYLASLIRLRLVNQDAVKPEYFYDYQPNSPLPKSGNGTIDDKKIVDDLLRLQPEYSVISDMDFVVSVDSEGESSGNDEVVLTESDLGHLDYEIVDDKYLVIHSDNAITQTGNHEDDNQGIKLRNISGIMPVTASEHVGGRSKTISEKSTYYMYLWFFLAKMYGDADLDVNFSGFYGQNAYESPVVNGMMFANNELNRLYNIDDYFDGYDASQVEDDLKIGKVIADKYHLQYLKSKSDGAKSDTTRWRRAKGKAKPKKVYDRERREEKAERAELVRHDYESSGLSDNEFLLHYKIARSTFYIYKRLWAKEDDKSESENAKLRSEIKQLKDEIRELRANNNGQSW